MSDPWDEAQARARAMRGSLDQRLEVIRDACRSLAPAYDAAVDALVDRLRAVDAGSAAPDVGDAFPDFALPDQAGRLWGLHAMRAGRPIVVALHRGGWCDFCQVNLWALAEAHERILQAGGDIVAVAPQRAAWGARHRADAGARFPMLSDVGGGVATLLGLSVVIDVRLCEALAAFDLDLAETNGDQGLLLPIPATFVIGRDGRVCARHIDVDPRRRMDVGAMVQAVSIATSRA